MRDLDTSQTAPVLGLGGEVYDENVEPWCADYFERAVRHIEQLGRRTRKNPSAEVLLLLGLFPQTAHDEHTADRYCVLLTRGSDNDQFRYQLGHEALHRVLLPPHTIHWTHKMVAELCTIETLRREGYGAHADVQHRASLSNTEVSYDELCHATRWERVAPFYATAYRLGLALVERLGGGVSELWRLLDTNPNEQGVPDVGAWLPTLPEDVQEGFAFMV